MIHRKLSELTASDGRVVIETDGNNYSVEVDIGGIESVTLQGDLTGSLVVSGDADCDAVRSGGRYGDVLRYGDGNGKAYRTGAGDGSAYHQGPGDGQARRFGAMPCVPATERVMHGVRGRVTATRTTRDPARATHGAAVMAMAMPCVKERARARRATMGMAPASPGGVDPAPDTPYVRAQVKAPRCVPGGEKETQSAQDRAMEAHSASVVDKEMPGARGPAMAARGGRDQDGEMQCTMAGVLVTRPGPGRERARPSAPGRVSAARSRIPGVRRGRAAGSARVCPRGSATITMSAEGAGWPSIPEKMSSALYIMYAVVDNLPTFRLGGGAESHVPAQVCGS